MTSKKTPKNSIFKNTWIFLGGYGLCHILIISGAAFYVSHNLTKINQSVIEFDHLSHDVKVIYEHFIHQAKNRKNLFLRGHNPTDLDNYSMLVDQATEDIEQQVNVVLNNPLSKPYHAELEMFMGDYEHLMQVYRQGVELLQNQDYRAGDRYVRGQGRDVETQLAQLLSRISADRQQHLLEKERQMQTFLIISILGLSLIIIVCSSLLAIAVTNPIRRIVRFSKFLEDSRQAQKATQINLNLEINPVNPEPPIADLSVLSHPQKHLQEDEISYMISTYSQLAEIIRCYTQQLQSRDNLLNCVNVATQYLVANEDLGVMFPRMLQSLGEGTSQSRAYILQISREASTDALIFNLSFEWDSSDTPPKRETGGEFPVPVDHFPESLITSLKAGQSIQFFARDLDGIDPSERLSGQARSLVGVPIILDGEWWGLLGLDNCLQEWVWSDAEIAVLETAATALGSAIERDRTRRVREMAEQEALIAQERVARAAELEAANLVLMTRDRWLETTAIAASELLSASPSEVTVKAALKTICENLECDRLGVMQYLRNAEEVGSFSLLYEWNSSDTTHPISQEAAFEMPMNDVADWTKQLMAGDSVGGLMVDQEDSFRRIIRSRETLCAYAVPIFIEAKFWGLMFMDYSREVPPLTSPELAVFKTAASFVGSAIVQENVRRDLAAQERSRLLGSVAEAANLLLRSADYEQVLPEVMRLLGEAVECDRCSLGQNAVHPMSDRPAVKIRPDWEWCRFDSDHAIDSKGHDPKFFLWEQAPYITQTLSNDDVVNCLVQDLPEPDRSLLTEWRSIAILHVPVTVDQMLWGFIAFDNCSELRQYDEAEIAILRVAAESIAAAVSRQVQDTSLRKSEERYRTLFEVSSEGFYRFEYEEPISIAMPIEEQIRTMELNFTIGECNKTYANMFGIENPEEFVGIKLTDVRAPGTEENLAFVRAYLQNGYQIQNYESQELGPDGQIIYVINNVIGFVKDGYTYGGWGSQLDITELKLAQKAQEAAEKAILQEQEKAARDRAAELAKINEAISKTLTTLVTSPELNQFLGNILVEMAQQLGACKVHLFLYEPLTDTLTQRLAIQDGQIYIGAAPNDPEMFRHPIPANLTPAWTMILNSPKPLTYDANLPYDEAIWWPNSLDWHQAQGHQAVTCIPMKAGEKEVGFIGFCFYNRTTLTDEQLEFMQALTNQAIVAIQLTRLAEQSQASALLDERNRLAREIHDTLAQAFTGVSLQLEAAKGVLNGNPDTAQIHIQRAGKLARRGLSEARRSVRALRSQALETDALADALQKNLAEATQDTALQIQFELRGSPIPLPEEIQLNLLRIGQEAITNTLRHAQATTLTLTLTFSPEQVCLRVADDGIGFDIQSLMSVTGFGLVGIRERTDRCAGHLQIMSGVNEGTVIEVTLPLDIDTEHDA